MSIFDTSPGGLAALGGAVALQFVPGAVRYRSIGGIVAPCTLEEHHEDTLAITDHPVEVGAVISDHAYLNPVVVEILIGWGAGTRVPLDQLYKQLRTLQQSRKPFKVVTGKRLYQNMLMEGLAVTTDKDTENVLKVHVRCRQVILVETQATTVAAASVQANPSLTAAVANRGIVQPAPVIPGLSAGTWQAPPSNVGTW